LVKFSKSWAEILEDRKKDFGQRTDENRVNTIAQNFADLFDFSVDTIKSHPLMDYCKFKTMPSLIKRLRNVVLILPTVEKTDESFYEAMIELIIDQDDVSSRKGPQWYSKDGILCCYCSEANRQNHIYEALN